MDLNDLLRLEGIDPRKERVLVARHTPIEPDFRKALPWLAAEKPHLYDVFQSSYWPHIQNRVKQANLIVSCVGRGSVEALFVGIYRMESYKTISFEEYWDRPGQKELQALGLKGWNAKADRPLPVLQFNLTLLDTYAEWKGKLLLNWPAPAMTWMRRAERNLFPVIAILEESALDKNMPAWNELLLSWEQIRHLPKSWVKVLEQWRGIYVICDTADGKSYVGSASGADNLYGRWMDHAASPDAKHLRGRNPEKFVFSILQLVAPDLDPISIVNIENRWMDRLHTREFGLNGVKGK